MPAGQIREERKSPCVLVVEDEAVSRMALVMLLSAYGYPTRGVGSAEEALELIAAEGDPSVALVDLDLPGMNGMELIRHLWEQNPTMPAVLITAAGWDRVSELVSQGVRHLRKPLDISDLLALLADNCTTH